MPHKTSTDWQEIGSHLTRGEGGGVHWLSAVTFIPMLVLVGGTLYLLGPSWYPLIPTALYAGYYPLAPNLSAPTEVVLKRLRWYPLLLFALFVVGHHLVVQQLYGWGALLLAATLVVYGLRQNLNQNERSFWYITCMTFMLALATHSGQPASLEQTAVAVAIGILAALITGFAVKLIQRQQAKAHSKSADPSKNSSDSKDAENDSKDSSDAKDPRKAVNDGSLPRSQA